MDIFPLKNRIYCRLYGKLHSGQLNNDCLPPEKDFARQLGISRNTLRSALEMLENEGILQRTRAVGTLLKPAARKPFTGSFLFCMVQKRNSPHVGESIFRGVQLASEACHGRADFCFVENLLKIPPAELRQLLQESCCRGLIALQRNFTGNEVFLNDLKSLGIPVVLAYCEKEDPVITGFAAVTHCGVESWLAALRHLTDSGHRRIATLTVEKEVIRECFSHDEYAKLLTSMGLRTEENPVLHSPMNDRAIKEKLTPLFNSSAPPDAILCYSDYWAPTVYRVLEKMKLRIPRDVSVMGYCGSLDSHFTSPALTTIAIGYEEIGRLAVRLIADAGSWFNIPGRRPPVFTTPYMLRIRESTRLR